jgi:hypothetical protein
LAQYEERFAPFFIDLSSENYSIQKALMDERKISVNMMSELVNAPESDAGFFERKVIRLFARPNASLNLAYDSQEIGVALAGVPSDQYLSARDKLESKQKNLFGLGVSHIYLQDPIAKILMSISTPALDTYIERQHDTQGYINLVALQLAILAQGVQIEEISSFLKKPHPFYVNPYSRQPMQWSSEKRELVFEGRQRSHQIFGMEKDVKIRIN